MKPKQFFLILLLLAATFGSVESSSAQAQMMTQTFSYSPNYAIPDNSTVGVSDTETIATSITAITSLQVTLNLTGNATAYNGDFYAYLTNGTSICVLLNREGRTAANTHGYADNGFNVTFADGATNGDIHSYRLTLNPAGGTLTGTWQPDGRNVNPATSLDTSARSAFLGSFAGQNPNGNWTLFVADVSPVGTGTFAGWSLQVTGTAVPEPQAWALLSVASTLVGLKRLRRRGERKRSCQESESPRHQSYHLGKCSIPCRRRRVRPTPPLPLPRWQTGL